ELLRGGEDRRDRLLVILKVAQMLLAERAVIGGDALAVVRVLARLHLVDEIAHGEHVILRRAEDQRLFLLVDRSHEDFDALLLALLDLDDPVEVAFGVAPAALHLALDQRVVGRIDVLVERGGNLLHLEWRQEAVIDAFLERVHIDRLSEVFVGVDIVSALGRGGEAELDGGGEVVEDAAPVALVVGAQCAVMSSARAVADLSAGSRARGLPLPGQPHRVDSQAPPSRAFLTIALAIYSGIISSLSGSGANCMKNVGIAAMIAIACALVSPSSQAQRITEPVHGGTPCVNACKEPWRQ